jgi:hypothetical protein
MMPPMPPPARSAMLPLALMLLLGCGDARQADKDQPTAEERQLIARITRDSFVRIDSWERDDLGHLIVTTRQGPVRVRYILMPDAVGEHRLNVHRIDDTSRIEVGASDQLGTGPRSGRAR